MTAKDVMMVDKTVDPSSASGPNHRKDTRPPSDSGKAWETNRVTDCASSSAVVTNPSDAAIAKAEGQSPRKKSPSVATMPPGAAIVKADGPWRRQKKIAMTIKPGAATAITKADGQSPRQKKFSMAIKPGAAIVKTDGQALKSTTIPQPDALIDLCNVDAPSVDENLPQNSRKRTKTKAESPSKKSRPASPIRGTGECGDAIDLCDSD